jgi:glycosyltransferase involved in cell wall biosynthesis
MIRVALLTTDSREHFKDYANPVPYFGTAPEALIEGFKLLPEEVEIHVLSCLQEAPVSSPAKLAENIYYHALRVPNIGWMKTGYQGCIRAVRRKLREIRPDIVHGQGTERDCAISAVLSGFPSVITVHGVMRAIRALSGSRRIDYYWAASILESFALRRTKGVIAISPYVDALVTPLTPLTWFIPNALQLFFLESSCAERLPNAVPSLVNVGVISPRKRQVELLEHLSKLREAIKFNVTFIGKPTYGSTYTERFLRLLHSVNSRHGGFVHREFLSEEEFLKLYDMSDAMVHFSSEESFGLTFAEALARNLPLFASDVGAIRQIGDGMAECRIFAPDDFTALIDSLRLWIEANAWTATRATLPSGLIAARYHPRVIAKEHLKVYREVADHTS